MTCVYLTEKKRHYGTGVQPDKIALLNPLTAAAVLQQNIFSQLPTGLGARLGCVRFESSQMFPVSRDEAVIPRSLCMFSTLRLNSQKLTAITDVLSH